MMIVSALLGLGLALPAGASNLDVSSSYKLHAVSYEGMEFNVRRPNGHSFILNDGRLAIAVRNIYLETKGPEDTTMDVGLSLHALGVANSTGALPSPFNRVAANYPSTDFTPFLENAYVAVHHLFGRSLDATFGRQNFKLGSGLLLDDDGAGMTGAVLRSDLPWGQIKTQAFFFNDRDAARPSPNSLDLFGFSFSLPTDGIWEFNELIEKNRAQQNVFGCHYAGMLTDNCVAARSVKSFTSARYQISYGPMVFDGEAAIERGVATPTGAPIPPQAPHLPGKIAFQADAEVVRAKWKQSLYKTGEGIARLSLARGSGDRGGTGTVDEAFFPAHGHRFDGLERSGFGDFFGATPYDAFGGNYSSTTASGLKPGSSGIVVVGAGYTPPAYKGWAFDIDFFLFQTDRVEKGSRTLGHEWDFRLRYSIKDHFSLAFSAATFRAGPAINGSLGTAQKYGFEASGRF